MLRLVGSDEGYSKDEWDAPEGGRASEAPAAHTDAQLRKLARDLSHQLPECLDEAVTVAEYLLEQARWLRGQALEIKRVEQERVRIADDDYSTKLLVVLTHSAAEERLFGHGFTGAASNYAARVIRSGFLSPKHFRA